MTEHESERALIEKLKELKYVHREDIRDRDSLEKNFRQKFEELNRVHLTDAEFQRLLDLIVTPDVFTAARTIRSINSFERDDGTPLNFTLVNIKEWCKNTFEVVNQLRINTDNSHHRYDVMLLINGVPVVQIELKTLAVSPRRAMQQISVSARKATGLNKSDSQQQGRLQERSWQRIRQDAALFPAAFRRHQSNGHLVLREQQRPALQLQRRRALPAGLSVRRRGQQEDHPPRHVCRALPGQVHSGADDQPLHGSNR